jgi:hypothetical protein
MDHPSVILIGFRFGLVWFGLVCNVFVFVIVFFLFACSRVCVCERD